MVKTLLNQGNMNGIQEKRMNIIENSIDKDMIRRKILFQVLVGLVIIDCGDSFVCPFPSRRCENLFKFKRKSRILDLPNQKRL
jgi:hypothetical protein